MKIEKYKCAHEDMIVIAINTFAEPPHPANYCKSCDLIFEMAQDEEYEAWLRSMQDEEYWRNLDAWAEQEMPNG